MVSSIKQGPQPLQQRNAIVDPQTGQPSDYFMKYVRLHGGALTDLDGAITNKVDNIRRVNTGTGLDGGGDLTADRTIILKDTAVTPGTYGSATKSAVITVDQQGRLTAVTEASIAGGGGGGGGSVIASHTFTGSESSFTFSSIPNTFKYLELVVVGRTESPSEDGAVELRFNGDTGANYGHNREFTNPSLTYSDANGATGIDCARLPGNGAPSSSQQAGGTHIKIFNYNNASWYTDTLASGSSFSGGTTSGRRQMFSSGVWYNTAVVTSITVYEYSGNNYTAGSTATLYGY